ncbi:hypothetical protein ACE6H2_000106 [Prunus campanulata]
MVDPPQWIPFSSFCRFAKGKGEGVLAFNSLPRCREVPEMCHVSGSGATSSASVALFMTVYVKP